MFLNFFFFFFILTFQPMMILISILGQTLALIIFNLYFLDLIWFSMVVMLLYIGGVLIIFLYLNSVSGKLVFKFNSFLMYLFLIFSMILFMTSKFNFLNFSDVMLILSFYSLKEFFFLGFVFYLFLFIFVINNLLLTIKSPLNTNL